MRTFYLPAFFFVIFLTFFLQFDTTIDISFSSSGLPVISAAIEFNSFESF